jgi:hypothetical protein
MPSQDYEEFIAASGARGRIRLEIGPRADELAEKQDKSWQAREDSARRETPRPRAEGASSLTWETDWR